ncbi:uncharacterized protein LOC132744208 [Ruditapes philippinarum]|uniref:uncharacterized protein LOC132744208 n=1 Tax=Ruditapes philippinarum TaxID=129788 RepID=UPI00295B614D|nr:uncharacterized protein LOC132744208 [Ruditapes philippinarum]
MKPSERRPIPDKAKKILRKILSVLPCDDDVICPSCRTKLYRSRQKKLKDTVSVPQPSTSQLISPPSVVLKIPSTSRSHSRCFVCKKAGPKLVRLGSECRLQAFLQHNIIVHSDARCCPVHVSDKTLKIDSVEVIDRLNASSYLNRSSFSNLLQNMRSLCIQQNSSLNFDTVNPPPERNQYCVTGNEQPLYDELQRRIPWIEFVRERKTQVMSMALVGERYRRHTQMERYISREVSLAIRGTNDILGSIEVGDHTQQKWVPVYR